MNVSDNEVPYFSQWETSDLTQSILKEGRAALYRDPLWRDSGAETLDEYARWAPDVCGMACLKMILAGRGETHQIMSLARKCTDYGGYVVDHTSNKIKGLIYAPFVTFVSEQFNLRAEVHTDVLTENIREIIRENRFFMASVNSSIRWPDREPPAKGGHLVLVTAASGENIRFHNPSGHNRDSQANVHLPLSIFDRFFANRGIIVNY